MYEPAHWRSIAQQACEELHPQRLKGEKLLLVVEKSGEVEREVVAMQKESQTNLVHDL